MAGAGARGFDRRIGGSTDGADGDAGGYVDLSENQSPISTGVLPTSTHTRQ